MLRRLLLLCTTAAMLGLVTPAIASAETADPTSVDFGTHTTATSQYVTVTNTDSQTHYLFGSGVTSSQTFSPFSVTPGCSILGPGQSCQMLIQFDPNRALSGDVPGGTYTAAVYLSWWNGVDAPAQNIQVSGTVGYPTATACCTHLQYSTFYPYKKDGYRDTDTFTYTEGWLAEVGDSLNILPFPGSSVGV